MRKSAEYNGKLNKNEEKNIALIKEVEKSK